MPNSELLLVNIAKINEADEKQKTLLTNVNLCYAYAQILLDTETKNQFNFSLIGEKLLQQTSSKRDSTS